MSWLLLFLIHNLAISIFRAIGAIARNLVVANACGSLMLMLILMQGGFVLPRGAIRGWWIWAYWIGLSAPPLAPPPCSWLSTPPRPTPPLPPRRRCTSACSYTESVCMAGWPTARRPVCMLSVLRSAVLGWAFQSYGVWL